MKELGKTIEGLLRKDRVTSNYIYSRVATEYPWGCIISAEKKAKMKNSVMGTQEKGTHHTSPLQKAVGIKKGRK